MQKLSSWIAGCYFNQIFLRLNLRFGNEIHLLILQNWFIPAQIDFLQITLWMTRLPGPFYDMADYFLSLSENSKSMVYKIIDINKYSNSIDSIIFKYYIDRCKFSKFVPLYKEDGCLIYEGNAQAPHQA